MLARLDVSRLTIWLLTLGPALFPSGLFSLNDHPLWGIALMVLAVGTTAGALQIARSDPAGRSVRRVVQGKEGHYTPGGIIGGGVFVGFAVGAILFSAARPVAPYLALGLYLVMVLITVLYAQAGVPAVRPARGASTPSPTAPDPRAQILDLLRNANVLAMTDSGMEVTTGAELGDRMMGHTATCRRCGTAIQFQQGGMLAMDMGIKDQVVACPSCRAIYEVQLGPRGMTLTADVSSRYGIQPNPASSPVAATRTETETVRLAAPSLKEELTNFQALAARQEELLGRLTPIEPEAARAFFARAGVDEPNRYDDALAAFGGMRQYAMTAEGVPIHATYLRTGEASADDFLFVHLADIPPLELLVCALSGGGYLGYYRTGKKLNEALGL